MYVNQLVMIFIVHLNDSSSQQHYNSYVTKFNRIMGRQKRSTCPLSSGKQQFILIS